MAVESDQIIADVVEISEFPDMAQRYAITGVPKIVINDQVELLGAQPESTFVAAVCELGNGNETSSESPPTS
jgi:predicted DsbA family dithiol-disulfide isomerase